MKRFFLACIFAVLLWCGGANARTRTFRTDYFKIEVDGRGYIVGMWNRADESRNFSPARRHHRVDPLNTRLLSSGRIIPLRVMLLEWKFGTILTMA